MSVVIQAADHLWKLWQRVPPSTWDYKKLRNNAEDLKAARVASASFGVIGAIASAGVAAVIITVSHAVRIPIASFLVITALATFILSYVYKTKADKFFKGRPADRLVKDLIYSRLIESVQTNDAENLKKAISEMNQIMDSRAFILKPDKTLQLYTTFRLDQEIDIITNANKFGVVVQLFTPEKDHDKKNEKDVNTILSYLPRVISSGIHRDNLVILNQQLKLLKSVKSLSSDVCIVMSKEKEEDKGNIKSSGDVSGEKVTYKLTVSTHYFPDLEHLIATCRELPEEIKVAFLVGPSETREIPPSKGIEIVKQQ